MNRNIIFARDPFLSHLYRFEDVILDSVIEILISRVDTLSRSELESVFHFVNQAKPCHHKAKKYTFKHSVY